MARPSLYRTARQGGAGANSRSSGVIDGCINDLSLLRVVAGKLCAPRGIVPRAGAGRTAGQYASQRARIPPRGPADEQRVAPDAGHHMGATGLRSFVKDASRVQ